MTSFDPIERAREIAEIVAQDSKRKYYRVSRPGRWYGGIASADCCGCNLQCVFCWSDKPRENPAKYGSYYTPEQVSAKLIQCAHDHHYDLVRVSGNEPTIAKGHLLKVIEIIDNTKLTFILETNGTLLDEEYAQELARFQNLHVRVSLKGSSPEEYSMLTGAIPETFDSIMGNLGMLVKHHIDFNLAVMLSFSADKYVALLKQRLKSIATEIVDSLEEEYVILYPHVARKLKNAGLEPLLAYTPGGIPKKLI